MSSSKAGANFLLDMNKVTTHISATDVKIDNGKLFFKIDGKEHAILLDQISEKLKAANASELQLFHVSPSGYGIHWPLIDEDISFKGLIQNK